MKNNFGKLLLIILLAFILFAPSLTTFFTHDDFFVMVISKAENIKDFVNFFVISPMGWGLYRPISTQVFYYLSNLLLNMNPISMHAVLYLLFGIIIILVYKIAHYLTENSKVSLIATFLYATSASHFGQLYFISTQEMWVGIFYFLSVWLYCKYLSGKSKINYLLSIISFVFALLSKEVALTLPFVLLLISIYKDKIVFRRLIVELIPFGIIVTGYLFFRVFHFGFTSGDSYVWDYSLRVFNTIVWYFLWAINIPEMLVDFIGPGFNINPNLLLYWKKEILFIIIPTIAFIFTTLTPKGLNNLIRKNWKLSLLGIFWFVGTLITVVFLPLHKFSFYLTIPLFGLVVVLSNAYKDTGKIRVFLGLLLWLLASYFSLQLTSSTHWITRGAKIAHNVDSYFNTYPSNKLESKIHFCDNKEDTSLVWLPSTLVKGALSDKNYFIHRYGQGINVDYGLECSNNDIDGVYIRARQFIGY